MIDKILNWIKTSIQLCLLVGATFLVYDNRISLQKAFINKPSIKLSNKSVQVRDSTYNEILKEMNINQPKVKQYGVLFND